MSEARFYNTLLDDIAINLNNELVNHPLGPIQNSPGTAIVSLFDYPIVKEPGKGTFSLGHNNQLAVTFRSSPNPARYSIEVNEAIRGDLCFFILGNALRGQDTSGSSSGIIISAETY